MKNEVAGKPCKVEFAHVWPVCIPLTILLVAAGSFAFGTYESHQPRPQTKVSVLPNPPALPAVPDIVNISETVSGTSDVCWAASFTHCHKLMDLFYPNTVFTFVDKGKTRQLQCESTKCVDVEELRVNTAVVYSYYPNGATVAR